MTSKPISFNNSSPLKTVSASNGPDGATIAIVPPRLKGFGSIIPTSPPL